MNGGMYVNGAWVEYQDEEELRQILIREKRCATRRRLEQAHTTLNRLKGKRINSRVKEVTL